MKLEKIEKILTISIYEDDLTKFNKVLISYIKSLAEGLNEGEETPEGLKTLQRLSIEFDRVLIDARDH